MSRIPADDNAPTYRRSTIRRRPAGEVSPDGTPGANPDASPDGTPSASPDASADATPDASAEATAEQRARALPPAPKAGPGPRHSDSSPRRENTAAEAADGTQDTRPPRPTLDGDALLAELEGLDQGAFAALLSAGSPTELEAGEEVTGTVVRVTADTIFVDIGAKSEAWLALAELEGQPVHAGERLTARVLGTGGQGVRLTRRLSGAAGPEALEAAMEAGIPVQGRVTDRNTGGFVVALGSTRAFCPVSHIDRHPDNDLDTYVGRTMTFKVLEVRGRDVVVSHRAVAQEEVAAQAAELWTTLKPGAELEGVVTGVKPYGAFVDVGGITGLVHTSELGWSRTETALVAGQRVQVHVVEIDPEAGRLGLSMKDEALGPWSQIGSDAEAAIQVGEVYEGKVVRLTDFGAFIELLPGLQGMAHISTLSDRRLGHPGEVLKVDQQVRVRVLSVDRARERLELGLRQASQDDWEPSGRARGGGDHSEGGSLGTLADLLHNIKVDR